MKKGLFSALTLLLVVSASTCLASCHKDPSSEVPPTNETPTSETPTSENPVVNKGAYILSDKATYLSYKNNAEGDKLPNLDLLYEEDNDMINTYTMIAVDPDGEGFGATKPTLNVKGADAFIRWMSLSTTRDLIKDYGKESYGESLFYLLESAPISTSTAYTVAATGATNNVIKISTTTSVNDSGLLGYLEPIFEEVSGFDIQIASAGTGAAINAAKAGNADLLLVHSKSQEEAFVEAKYAREVDELGVRVSFMYNYFVLIGPKTDPVGAKTKASVTDAFAAIAAGKYSFVSRGDNSGTHTKEIALWKGAGINDIGYDTEKKEATFPATYTWYVSTGQGMGASLLVANDSAIQK